MAICAQDAPLLEPVMTVAEDDGDTAADDPATLSARSRVECAPSHSLPAHFKQCLCRPYFCLFSISVWNHRFRNQPRQQGDLRPFREPF